jgi:hypothetical protein
VFLISTPKNAGSVAMSVVSEAVENIASIGADALACPLPWDRELVSIAIISLKREYA